MSEPIDSQRSDRRDRGPRGLELRLDFPFDIPAADHGPDRDDDVLGLDGTYPRPGWVVLDAIRDIGFTGEVVCRTSSTSISIYSDRGQPYLAQRDDDPSFGARLVETGALDPTQLAHGAMSVEGAEHLGHLFERVPGLDRLAVTVAAERLADSVLGWLAAQRVYSSEVTPYRHHPSGVHRWSETAAPIDSPAPLPSRSFAAPAPTSTATALPAPGPMAPPVPMPPPIPMPAPIGTPPPGAMPAPIGPPSSPAPDAGFGTFESPPPVSSAPSPPSGLPQERDDVIRWNVPSFLDRPAPSDESEAGDADESGTPSGRADEDDPVDWFDRVGPLPSGEPDGGATVVPDPHPDRFDRFDVIWPSGEVDEQVGGRATPANPDIDRAGPTARMVRDGGRLAGSHADAPAQFADADLVDALGTGVADLEVWLAEETQSGVVAAPAVSSAQMVEGNTHDVVLAVRRAVASIESGALARRDRRTGPRAGLAMSVAAASQGDSNVVPPGRVAALEGPGAVPQRPAMSEYRGVPSGSVFDEDPLPAPVLDEPEPGDVASDQVDRGSALRRLIGSLRRR